MKQLALVLSLFVVILGAIGIIRPEALLGVARHFQTPAGLYAAAALRIILGVALLFAASTSRAPGVIRVLGILVLVAGLITPFVGTERVRAIVDWWSSQGPLIMRAWAGFALAFGSFLVWALFRKSSAA
jgi:uncharacterized membrane protein